MSVTGRGPYLQQIQEYREKLYQYRDENSMQSMRQLLTLQVEDIKNKLLKATPETFLSLQAEAYAYNTMLLWLSTPPNRIPVKGE